MLHWLRSMLSLCTWILVFLSTSGHFFGDLKYLAPSTEICEATPVDFAEVIFERISNSKLAPIGPTTRKSADSAFFGTQPRKCFRLGIEGNDEQSCKETVAQVTEAIRGILFFCLLP